MALTKQISLLIVSDELIKNINLQIMQLSKYRQTLISNIVTGKVKAGKILCQIQKYRTIIFNQI